MAVDYDATGSGGGGIGTRLTSAGATLTHPLGPAATAIIAGVGNYYSSSVGYSSLTSNSCLIGATPMTLLGYLNCDNKAASVYQGWVELWGLVGSGVTALAGTTPTITYKETLTGTTYPYTFLNSVSYTGVASFGTDVTNYGATTAITTGSVASAANNMVVAAMGCFDSKVNLTGSGTSRYNTSSSGSYGSLNVTTLIQDITGASTVTMTASQAASGTDDWATIAVNMVASAVVTPTNLFFPFLTMAPLALLGAPSLRYATPKARKSIRKLLQQREEASLALAA